MTITKAQAIEAKNTADRERMAYHFICAKMQQLYWHAVEMERLEQNKVAA